jgi:hypothetical protein
MNSSMPLVDQRLGGQPGGVTRVLVTVGVSVVLALSVPAARAAMPVIDVGAIVQLVQQLANAREQLATLRDELRQLEQQYRAATGTRGMERRVPTDVAARNYLPVTGEGVDQLRAGRDRSGLGRALDDLLGRLPEWSPRAADQVAPALSAQWQDARQRAALLETLMREVVGETSLRFAQVDALRAAIADAQDPKAIADLTARIGIEQAMLTNEHTKVASLSQLMEGMAQQSRLAQQQAAIEGLGSVRTLAPVVIPLPAVR